MQLENIVGDIESFWDTDYTLKKLSTTEYVRDARWETMGIAILRESEGYKPKFIRGPDVAAYLATIDWSKVRFIAHNTHFDGLVLAERFGVVPAQYVCTQSLARYVLRGKVRHSVEAVAKYFKLQGKLDGLKETKGKRCADLTEAEWEMLGTYAIHDAKLELYYYLKLSPDLPADYWRIMDMTFRMFCDPVLEVDLALAREAFTDAVTHRTETIGAGGVDITVLRSREKFAQLLRDCGIEPPLKKSKTTGKPTYAFARDDESFTELLEHPEESIRNLVEAKLESSSNLPLTRAQRLITIGETGKLAVALHPWGAKTTLRFSAGNKMNMQNFVRGSKLRRAIRAALDHVIVVADQAQIECRMNLWFCEQEDGLEIFRSKGDIYSDMASTIYGRPIDRKKKLLDEHGVSVRGEDGDFIYPEFTEGFVGKTSVLSLGYQAGARRLQHALATDKKNPVKLSLEECYHIVSTYRMKNWKITAMWETCREWLDFMCHGKGTIKYKCITIDADNHKIWGPDGSFLYYPGLSCDGGQYTYIDNGGASIVYIYGGKLLENIIQWLAGIVIRGNMLTIADAGWKIASMTHDEIIGVCHKNRAQEFLDFMIATMRKPASWCPDLPLDAEGTFAEFYCK